MQFLVLGEFLLHVLDRLIEFFHRIVMENKDVADAFRLVEIAAGNILVPVLKLPGVSAGVSLDHSLMTHFRRSINPDNHQIGVLFLELGSQILDVLRISDFPGKRSVDQHVVCILKRFIGDIENCVILVVADILFKEIRAAVVFLVGNFKICLERTIRVSLSR